MDFIIGFFRDVLDGPLYIIVTVICSILICSCIGYLAEQSINKKKKQQEYDDTHATVSNDGNQQIQSVATQTPAEINTQNVGVSNQQSVASSIQGQPAQPMPQPSIGSMPTMQAASPVPDTSSDMMVSPDQINSVLGPTQSVPEVPANMPQAVMSPVGTAIPQPSVTSMPGAEGPPNV